MIDVHYFYKKMKDVTPEDIAAVFTMMAAMLLIPFYKKRYKNTWLICEVKREARDNGYHFFKYLCQEQPQQDCVYAISPRCEDWDVISQLGKTVPYGSIKHWVLYFTARYNISSQKGGKPNAALCSLLELNDLFRPHNVFLQHGVTKDKNDWLMADKCRFDVFITATTSEYSFVQHAFGYNPTIIHYTGFPRFDNLHNNTIVKNRIIIMPTWRKWLTIRSEKNNKLGGDFETSAFINKWMELLNSQKFTDLINKYQLEVIFYPHRGMQKNISKFHIVNPQIVVASTSDYNVQELLKSSQLLITDYSSIYFDMLYMKKPVIFYQFDEAEFRKFHYEEGWFNYHCNPFANSYSNYKDVLVELENYILSDYKISESFLEAHKKEFTFYDTENSARVFQLLINNDVSCT